MRSAVSSSVPATAISLATTSGHVGSLGRAKLAGPLRRSPALRLPLAAQAASRGRGAGRGTGLVGLAAPARAAAAFLQPPLHQRQVKAGMQEHARPTSSGPSNHAQPQLAQGPPRNTRPTPLRDAGMDWEGGCGEAGACLGRASGEVGPHQRVRRLLRAILATTPQALLLPRLSISLSAPALYPEERQVSPLAMKLSGRSWARAVGSTAAAATGSPAPLRRDNP